MSIPKNFTIQRSTPMFVKHTIPKALFNKHNTAAGVYGQIVVIAGILTFCSFNNYDDENVAQEIVVKSGTFTVTPPQLWHKIKVSDDIMFNINFWSDPEKRGKQTINTKK